MAGNSEDYLNFFLRTAFKIVNSDGANIANDAKVGLVNCPIALSFSHKCMSC